MAKYVKVTDLTDTTLFDSDGFPLASEETTHIVREQRKHGVHSWDENTKVGRSIWDSAGPEYQAIERIPLRFDMDISGSPYTITSGAGPCDDIKGFLRSEIPIDATVTLRCLKESTQELTVSNPVYDLLYKVDGYALINSLDIDPVDYEFTVTVVWPNPNNILENITTQKVFRGSSISYLNYDDDPAQVNRNMIYQQLLIRGADGKLRPDTRGFERATPYPATITDSIEPELLSVGFASIERNNNIAIITLDADYGFVTGDYVAVTVIDDDLEFNTESAQVTVNNAGTHTLSYSSNGINGTLNPTTGNAGTVYFDRWSLSLSYTNTDIEIQEDAGHVSPYAFNSRTYSSNETHTGISYIVAPFTRAAATEVQTPTEVYIGSKQWAFSSIEESVNFIDDLSAFKRDITSIFDGYGSSLASRVVYINSSTNSLKCVQNGETNTNDIVVTLTGNIVAPTVSVTFAEISEITGASVTTTNIADLTYDVPTTQIIEAQSPVLIDDISIGDIQYLDIADLLNAMFPGLDYENDTYSIVVKSTSTSGLVVEYEPYRIIVRRIQCIEDDDLYVRVGYYWINEEEKYLYNNPIVITGVPVNGYLPISGDISEDEILNFSNIEVKYIESNISGDITHYADYNFLVDDISGTKSLTDLINSYYYSDGRVYVSSDISGETLYIKVQPNDDIYVDTNLSTNPLISWKRRYFAEYSSYIQTLTSVVVEKFDSLINIYAYDQYGSPKANCNVIVSAPVADPNFLLVNNSTLLLESTLSLYTNDEGRTTVYYETVDDNLELTSNICTIEVDSAITKTITMNNNGEVNSNVNENWILSVDGPSAIRAYSIYECTVNVLANDGTDIFPVIGEISLEYKLYGDAGYIDITWQAATELVEIDTATKKLRITPTIQDGVFEKALYKITITPSGYSPKIITFRSY
jgi:hypothetical protein